MAHAFNSSTWEAEAGSRVRGQPGLQSEFQGSRGYTEKPCLENKTKQTKQTKQTKKTKQTKQNKQNKTKQNKKEKQQKKIFKSNEVDCTVL